MGAQAAGGLGKSDGLLPWFLMRVAAEQSLMNQQFARRWRLAATRNAA